MNTIRLPLRLAGVAIAGLALLAPTAQAAKKNPTSKLYVANLEGQSEIDTGERIEDLQEKSVHNAQGTIIHTKSDSTNAMVFSNGTGVFVSPDSRLEVRRFAQEPFSPNRTDLEVEPSISKTLGFIPRGSVGLCAPKMVAGSTMVYATPHGAMNIRGRRVVIESTDFETKISMVEGEVTVRPGANGAGGGGGETIGSGQQAIIRQLPGRAPEIEIRPIPDDERQAIDDKVAQACNARRTVYFDTRQKPEESPSDSSELVAATDAEEKEAEEETEEDLAAGTDGGDFGQGWGNVFDETDTDGPTDDNLVIVEVTPVEPAPEFSGRPVSASSIASGS